MYIDLYSSLYRDARVAQLYTQYMHRWYRLRPQCCHGLKNSIASCSASHWQRLGPYAPFLGQRWGYLFSENQICFCFDLGVCLEAVVFVQIALCLPLSPFVSESWHKISFSEDFEHSQNRITFAALCWVVIWFLWKTRLGMDPSADMPTPWISCSGLWSLATGPCAVCGWRRDPVRGKDAQHILEAVKPVTWVLVTVAFHFSGPLLAGKCANSFRSPQAFLEITPVRKELDTL